MSKFCCVTTILSKIIKEMHQFQCQPHLPQFYAATTGKSSPFREFSSKQECSTEKNKLKQGRFLSISSPTLDFYCWPCFLTRNPERSRTRTPASAYEWDWYKLWKHEFCIISRDLWMPHSEEEETLAGGGFGVVWFVALVTSLFGGGKWDFPRENARTMTSTAKRLMLAGNKIGAFLSGFGDAGRNAAD